MRIWTMKKLWMAVTADKYELPLAVETSQTVLARRMGVTPGTIMKKAYQYQHAINKRNPKSGRKPKYWIVGVEVEEGSD